MKRRPWAGAWIGLLVALVGLLPTPSSASDEAPRAPLTYDELTVRPKVREVLLAPTGDRLAALFHESYGASIWVTTLPDGVPRKLCDTRRVERLHWSTDGTRLFLETAERLGVVSVDAVSRDDGRPSWIVELDAERKQAFVEVDPVLPRHVLVQEELADDRRRWLRVDEHGTVTTVFESTSPITDTLFDPSGAVRFVKAIDDDAPVIERWIERGAEIERRVILRCPVLDPCGLVAFDGERLWMRSRLDGDRFDLDRWHLVAVDPTSGRAQTVHGDPEGLADLGRLVLGSTDRRPLMVAYETDRLRFYGLDPATERHLRALRERFADGRVEFQAEDSGPFWLLRESGPRLHHARFHLYDTRDRSLREVFADQRESVATVPPDRLAAQQPITYRASDGMLIHGYVWLPAGGEPRTAPVVALVHGGPWNRDRYGFHAGAQWLTDRGYVVFQPNFRGSSGYGLAYLLAAKGELSSGRVHQDIVDGLDHLAARGIGDPQNTAIVGHSYGGFAALAAAIEHPERYRAAVATAPPIDLIRAFRDLAPEHETPNGVPLATWMREVFVDLDDAEAVAEERRRSPEMRLDKTAVPLLMMAGGLDEKVSVVDVRHFAGELAALDHDVSLLVDDAAGHSFDTPHMPKARAVLTERFLGRWLGGDVLPTDDPELDAYLASRMVLTGPSLVLGEKPAGD